MPRADQSTAAAGFVRASGLPAGAGATEAVFQQLAQATESERASRLAAYHRQSISALNLQWLADTRMIGGRMPQGFRVVQNPDGKPTALQSTTLAMTKRVTEVNVLRSMTAGSEALGALTDEAAWNKLAALHFADARLDEHSIGLMQRQTRALSLLIQGQSTSQPRKEVAA